MPPSFAGFTLKERISVDTFGETYLAVGPAGRKARVRRLDASLGERRNFAPTLLAGGQRLAGMEHPNVVATIAVGRDAQGALIVVTEDLAGPIALDVVLRDAGLGGARASVGVALHLARAIARALARAHQAGVVHGGVHPRSVWIDIDGEVRLGDFAVARAMATASSEDSTLFRGMLGYVAPELALGDAPGPPSDVFAAGAMLHELLTGSPPPGASDVPNSLPGVLVDALRRALATDPERRFRDGTELQVALDAVAAQVGLLGVGPPDVAKFVAENRGQADASLDAETEGLLADLGAPAAPAPEPVRPPSARRPVAGAAPPSAARNAGTAARVISPPVRLASDQTPLPVPIPADEIPSGGFSALREEAAALAHVARAATPLEPFADAPSGPVSAAVSTPPRGARLSPPPPARAPGARRAATPSIGARARRTRGAAAAGDSRAPVAPTPPLDADLEVPTETVPRRSWGWLWALAVLLTLAALAVVVVKLREKEREAEEAKRREAAAHEQKVVKFGDIDVESDPSDAAVWMLLGRTPLDTMPLDASRLYELRLEHEGYTVADVALSPAQWKGTGQSMTASIHSRLEVAPAGYVPPSSPPEPPPAAAATQGRGQAHIESEPPGAQVWLLVGFTPGTRVTNLPVDRSWELKIVRDGHVPGYAIVRPGAFEDRSGRPGASVAVKLAPRPTAKGAKGPR